MKQRAVRMSMAPKYVRRRRWAAVAIIGMAVFITMLIYPVLDSVAEGACVEQLDAKSEWAVACSKANGDYPF